MSRCCRKCDAYAIIPGKVKERICANSICKCHEKDMGYQILEHRPGCLGSLACKCHTTPQEKDTHTCPQDETGLCDDCPCHLPQEKYGQPDTKGDSIKALEGLSEAMKEPQKKCKRVMGIDLAVEDLTGYYPVPLQDIQPENGCQNCRDGMCKGCAGDIQSDGFAQADKNLKYGFIGDIQPEWENELDRKFPLIWELENNNRLEISREIKTFIRELLAEKERQAVEETEV